MFVRKEQGGCTVAGYTWVNDGDVVEVPDWLGADLLVIKGAGYTQVIPKNLAEEVALTQAPVRTEDDLGVPVGAAKVVLDWVGTDKDRAAVALKSEQAKGDDARTSLIAELVKRSK